MPNEKQNIFLAAALLVLTGAFFWAMRGANGYGGISGAVLPGLMWGLIWHGLESRSNRQTDWVIVACAIGFGVGGFNGYGDFISWINGRFYLNYPNDYKQIEPMVGYAWLFACGAGWGGVGGHILASALYPEKNRAFGVMRFLCLPAGAVAGYHIFSNNLNVFAPLYSKELYEPSICKDCGSALEILKNVSGFIGAYTAALIYDAARGRWRSLLAPTICAVGFGLAFAGSGPIQLLNKTALEFDWWKVWELTIGAVAGASVAFVYLINGSGSNKVVKASISGVIAGELAVFVVFNWAFQGCARTLAANIGLVAGHPLHWLFSAIALLVSTGFLTHDAAYTIKRLGQGASCASVWSKTIVLQIAFSIMAFIVIYPDKKMFTVFILLSSAILAVMCTVKYGCCRLNGNTR